MLLTFRFFCKIILPRESQGYQCHVFLRHSCLITLTLTRSSKSLLHSELGFRHGQGHAGVRVSFRKMVGFNLRTVWRTALRPELRASIRVGLWLLVSAQGHAHIVVDFYVFSKIMLPCDISGIIEACIPSGLMPDNSGIEQVSKILCTFTAMF